MSEPVTRFRPPLAPEGLPSDPIQAFSDWLDQAEAESEMNYPNAVTLSTVTPEGAPDGRIVLLKGVDGRGFLFFTNYESEKGRALVIHPRAALTFYWDGMGRQVRVRGRVERLPPDESDEYFRSRPRGSQLGAWASAQSRSIESREALMARFRELEEEYDGKPVPRPEHWGGYVLRPDEVELWQEAPFRMHDRLLYRRQETGWTLIRLSP